MGIGMRGSARGRSERMSMIEAEDGGMGRDLSLDGKTKKLYSVVGTVLFGAFGFGWNTGVMNNAKAAIQTCEAEPHRWEYVLLLSVCAEGE